MANLGNGLAQGGEKGLDLIIRTILALVIIGIFVFIGYNVMGNLQNAGQQTNFSPEIEQGMEDSVTDYVSNINYTQIAVVTFLTLLGVIVVLLIFWPLISAYMDKNKGSSRRKSKGGGMNF